MDQNDHGTPKEGAALASQSSVPAIRTGFSLLDAQLPGYLSGQGRANRPGGFMTIEAENDLQAIGAWLEGLRANTFAAYRKSAYRFLAWCVTVRKVPFSDVRTQDWLSYEAFITNPPQHWISQGKPAPFGSLGYRFFKGPLSPKSIKHERVVIHGLYSWLVAVRYLQANPLAAMARRHRGAPDTLREEPEQSALAVREEREKQSPRGKALSARATKTIEAYIDQMPRTGLGSLKRARCRWVFNLLRYTGLRASELMSITSSEDYLEIVNPDDNTSTPQVTMHLVGKGGKYRKIPWPKNLYMDFYVYRINCGIAGDRQKGESIPLLLSTDSNLMRKRTLLLSTDRDAANVKITQMGLAPPITRQSLYQLLKSLYENVASWCADPEIAEELKGKGVHTLRHTFASNIVDSADIKVAMKLLGHSNMATTSMYSHADDHALVEAVEAGSKQ